MMHSLQVITSPAEIDLSKHSLIEASAGTGKTFTISKVVVQLLSRGVPLEKILIVTFTDKATSELRDRVRSEIEEKCTEDDPEGHFKKALNSFANAMIFTIHGFCQRVLKENAFENKQVFDLEVVNDYPLFKEEFNKIKRSWPSKQGLDILLKDAGFNSAWEEKILKLAINLDRENTSIYPPGIDEGGAGNPLEENIDSKINDIQELNRGTLLDEYARLVSQNRCSQKGLDINKAAHLDPFFALLDNYDTAEEDRISHLHEYLNVYSEKNPFSKGVFKGFPALLLDKSGNRDSLPTLFTFMDAVEELSELFKKSLCSFVIATALQLQKQAVEYKRNKGYISFNDMISGVYSVLKQESEAPSTAALLTDKLREQYEFGLIDEFQDTDLKQWYIFKTIFLHDTHTLMLIGDPKQAIYRFRGADVNAYKKARTEMLALGESKSGGYRLATNYRSVPSLITNLNTIWNRHFYEPAKGNGQGEADVASAPDAIRQEKGPLLLSDTSETGSLNIFPSPNKKYEEGEKEMREGMGVKAIQGILFEEMLKRIESLIGAVTFMHKGTVSLLNHGDIAILTRSRTVAIQLEEDLHERGIPASFYKKEGLYSSREAMELDLLLTSLAEPFNRKALHAALLTDFFALSITDLDDFDNEDCAMSNVFLNRISDLAAEKEWPSFFNTLLYESPVLYKTETVSNVRRKTNFKQITQDLLQKAVENNFDLKLLQKELSRRRKDVPEEDVHQKETEKPRILIMTIHASKGLEFPVVFLYPSICTKSNSPMGETFFDTTTDTNALVVSKSITDSKIKSILKNEEKEEEQRILYVAFTRAIFKLFLPYYFRAQRGTPSCYTSEFPQSELFVADNFEGGRPDTNPGFELPTANADEQVVLPPFNAARLTLFLRLKKIYSFSGLSHVYAQQLDDLQFGNTLAQARPHELDDDDVAEKDTHRQMAREDAREYDLPHGAQTGNILHGIFENVCFDEVGLCSNPEDFLNSDMLMAVVDSQMLAFEMENTTEHDEEGREVFNSRDSFASLVWHTLHKALEMLGGVKLHEIGSQKVHELEFFTTIGDHRLTGYIDLFFAIGDNYYILDWKSNYCAEGYDAATLEKNMMQAHHYNLQYQLYAMAMQRWFDALDLDTAHLAGALYIFSRGINAFDTTSNGIFFADFCESKQTLISDTEKTFETLLERKGTL